jgi:poly-gamma-glutamate synthesis protein (capsule biosynthesis protein)
MAFIVLLLSACRPAEPLSPAVINLPTVEFPLPTPPIAGNPDPGIQPPVATPTLATEALAPAGATPTASGKEAHLIPQPPPSTRPAAAARTEGLITVGAAAGLPPEILAAAQQVAAQNPDRFAWVGAAENPDVRVAPDTGSPLAEWVYAVAVPFATLTDTTSAEAVLAGWQSGESELGRLLIASDTAAAAPSFLGGPSPAGVAGSDLMGELWAMRPSWTILPFDQLRPEFKTLSVDGQSPLVHEFDTATYPFVMRVGASGDEADVAAFLSAYTGPTTNRDPARLTRVAMSGVTALVRATAYQMEQNGVLYPGEEVAPIFQSADIAHVSNEVSFMADCPFPDPYGGVTFCSHDRYFALLEALGIDVVELTGNHINDYGRQHLVHSLDLYAAAGMDWFGGGRDLADAQRAAVFTHNGNRVAFVGCNPVGPANAWATVDAAGSRPCDDGMAAQIRQLRNEGYVVIATLQYTEYYQYQPTPQQAADFIALAQAGAAGVSGSQGHHAQSFAFEDGSFIHYGLGNLFFDQMDMLGTRQSLVDTYVIYDGRLIGVELWTGLIENWARPRLMTPEERADTLQSLFSASGW